MAGVAALLVSTPASAAPSPTDSAPVLQTEAKSEFDGLFEQAFGPAPAKAAVRLGQLITQTDESPRLSILRALRGAALIGTNDLSGAAKEIEASNALDKEERFGDRMQFLAGLVRKRHDQSSIALDRLISAAPDLVRDLDIQSIGSYFVENKTTSPIHLDDQRIALAKMGYGGRDGIYMTLRAARILLDRGRDAESAELIPHFDDLTLVQQALTDRRFAKLWLALAKAAGDHGTTIAAETIRKARVELDAAPQDLDRRRHLLGALASARQYVEAEGLGAGFATTDAGMAALDEPGGWLVNDHALVLLKMGKLEEADRRFESLNSANAGKPWVVSMVINRAELLVQTGRYQAAGEHLADVEAFTAKNGNPYARQLVRRLKLCNAIGLQQSAAVPALIADLKAHSDDSRHATVEGLLCAGDKAGAEKIVVGLLADPDVADSAVILLQHKPLDRDDPSMWVKSWQSLRGSPAVEAAFAKAGRDLPDLYYVE